jgi:hypothetical protein
VSSEFQEYGFLSSPDEQGHAGRSLRQAIVQARTTQADRQDAVAEVSAAETARLELVLSELGSVVAEIPDEADQFLCALVPGEPPRLWVDMVSYVVMAPDKRTYRFVTDTRAGRVVRLETPDVRKIADVVTDYLAHRMIDRERGLERAPTSQGPAERVGYSAMAVVLGFLAGACFGVFALFVLALVLSAP